MCRRVCEIAKDGVIRQTRGCLGSESAYKQVWGGAREGERRKRIRALCAFSLVLRIKSNL